MDMNQISEYANQYKPKEYKLRRKPYRGNAGKTGLRDPTRPAFRYDLLQRGKVIYTGTANVFYPKYVKAGEDALATSVARKLYVHNMGAKSGVHPNKNLVLLYALHGPFQIRLRGVYDTRLEALAQERSEISGTVALANVTGNPRAKRHGATFHAAVTLKQVDKMKKLYAKGKTQHAIATVMNLSQGTVSRALRGQIQCMFDAGLSTPDRVYGTRNYRRPGAKS